MQGAPPPHRRHRSPWPLRLGQPDRFVPSLLRGRLLVDSQSKDLSLVDNANTTTRLLSAAACFPPGAAAAAANDNGDEVKLWRPVAARDGLVILEGISYRWPLVKLCVYCPATGYVQALPPGLGLGGRHVLLVGDGGPAGCRRPFQVINLTLSRVGSNSRVQKFSSEQGTWATSERIAFPLTNGDEMLSNNSVLVGDVVHWLCHQRLGMVDYYVVRLHVSADDDDGDYRISVTKLPKSFHRACSSFNGATSRMVLATAEAGRRPIVLVASGGVISVWAQSSELTGEWRKQPDLIVDCEAMHGICTLTSVRFLWFAERSGLVLLAAPDSSTFLLDLQSKKITKYCSSSSRIISKTSVPYEMDPSSWVPTFSKIF
ncbi:hypothetical protein HU200_019863 [Digitaria exilis]|uniref:DUF7595 domain-containing protein n=1 Tax=Digitaria exilis TaxID=1010633 RepID=A0A835F2U5_9POAL|nr:hypothetical protein HU200_019863 [Digitaria exilis]